MYYAFTASIILENLQSIDCTAWKVNYTKSAVRQIKYLHFFYNVYVPIALYYKQHNLNTNHQHVSASEAVILHVSCID